MQTPILLTRAAAARRLDVTPAALDRLKIRTIRVGRRRMFRSEDILERVRGDVPDNAVEALAGYLGSRAAVRDVVDVLAAAHFATTPIEAGQ